MVTTSSFSLACVHNACTVVDVVLGPEVAGEVQIEVADRHILHCR